MKSEVFGNNLQKSTSVKLYEPSWLDAQFFPVKVNSEDGKGFKILTPSFKLIFVIEKMLTYIIDIRGKNISKPRWILKNI